MTETLYIHRDWGNGLEYSKSFTLDTLESIRVTLDLDSEEFTELITGLSEDDYADNASDILREVYEDAEDVEDTFTQCMGSTEFQTCYTVFRLWNTQLTPEEAESAWKESCLDTLNGIVEG